MDETINKTKDTKPSDMHTVEIEIESLKRDLVATVELSGQMVDIITGDASVCAKGEERIETALRFQKMKDVLRIECNNDSLQRIRDNIQKVIDMTKVE